MMRLKPTGFVMLAVLAATAQSVVGLNVQLQMVLTKDGVERQNDAYLSIAAAGFLAIKHFNNRESPVISLGDNCDATTQLNVEFVDTQGDEKLALNALLTKTPLNQPDLIIGPLTSKEAVPVALVASVQQVPIIAYSATSQTLDDNAKFSTFLRTVPSDKTVAEAVCKLFNFYSYKYISVLYVDDVYGSAYKDAVTSSCRDLEIATRAISFKLFDAASVENAVTTLRSFGSNIVVVVAFGADVKTAVRQALEIGMIGPGKLWVFSDAADSATLQDVATEPELAEALNGNLRMYSSGTIRGHGRFNEFSTHWKTLGGSGSTGLADLAYVNDALNISASLAPLDASFFLGSDSSIYTYASYLYDTIIAAGLAECEAGSGGLTDLLGAMRNRAPPVEGVSGAIQYGDNGSRDPRTAYFVVENLLWDASILTLPSVGYLNATSGTLVKKDLPVTFAGNTETPPLDRAIVVTDYNYISDLVFNAALTMVVILFLLTFSLIIWVVLHRKSRVVQHSQGLFLITLLFGTMLSSATILPLVLDDHHVSEEVASTACMASPWLYSLGFVITFSALFAKTYRIAKIFNNKLMQRIKIRTRDLFAAVGVLAFVDGTFLAAWQISSPLRWQRGRTQVDSFDRTLQSLGMCTDIPVGMTAVEGIDSNTFLAILACLHVGLLMYGNYLTYTARNLPTTFQESRWIGLAMGSMLQLFMMGVPIVYAVADDPTARGLVMTSVIFLHNMVLIGAVMFPKLHAFYFLSDGKGMTGHGTTGRSNRTSGRSVAPGTAVVTSVAGSSVGRGSAAEKTDVSNGSSFK